MDIVLIAVIVIVVVLVIAAIALYNNLVKLRNMVDNAWAQIDVQLQRRLVNPGQHSAPDGNLNVIHVT